MTARLSPMPTFPPSRRLGVVYRRRPAAFLLLLILALLAPLPGAGQSGALFGNGNVTVDGFQTRGLNQDGAVEWELFGSQAKVKGTITELNEFKINLMQDSTRPIELTSPRCRYYHRQAEVRSDAPVQLQSDGITITGLGYDVFLDRKVVLVRSTVHITLKGRNNKLEAIRKVQP